LEGDRRNPPVNRILDCLQETIKGDICQSRSTTSKPRLDIEESKAEGEGGEEVESLATETIQSTALALECVDNVEGGDCLSLGVLGVGDGIANDTLEERFQNTTGLFVDH
jgi:hypothetical protein